MAGGGQRFKDAHYGDPKPLIPTLHDKPMISLVVENLTPPDREDIEFIFICQKEHYEKYDLENVLGRATKGKPYQIVQINKKTEGAACTVLMAADLICADDELIIANSDQFILEEGIDLFYEAIEGYRNEVEQVKGIIMSFKASHPKWSYIRLSKEGKGERVLEVAEKKVISDHATTGIYWFRHGKDFVDAACKMIAKDIRVNGEFYVAPVFNEMILDDQLITHLEIQPEEMFGLGTPEDLKKFLGKK